MKKILPLLFLICSITAFAQTNGVTFKVKFLPNTNYTTTLNTFLKSAVTLNGSEEQMARVKANGVTLPIIVESKSNMISTISTGALLEDQSFPAVISYGEVKSSQTSNGKEKESESPISGLIAKGRYNSEGKFRVDTLMSDKLNDGLRHTLKATLESVQQQILYPDKPMRIGDKFEQKIPMSIPVSGMDPVKVTINTEYKLRDINGDLAIFDITQTVQLDMQVEQSNIKALGSGTGVSEFSVKNSFMTKYESNMDMQLTMDVNGFNITTAVNSKTNQQVEIK